LSWFYLFENWCEVREKIIKKPQEQTLYLPTHRRGKPCVCPRTKDKKNERKRMPLRQHQQGAARTKDQQRV